MTNYNLVRSAYSRVFLIEGRARPDHEPEYMGCMMAGSPDQSFGDVERIECPSPDEYGKFVVRAKIKGATEPATITLTNRYGIDVISDLLRIARRRCALDAQVHFGECSDPSDFNVFQKALIFEDADLGNWSAEDLGALASDANAKVDESSDLSAVDMYEVVPLSTAERGLDVIAVPLNDVVICSKPECGDCDDEDDGCEVIFAVSDDAGGSPGTGPDLVWSDDSGATLYADDINVLLGGNAVAVACLKDYVVVISYTYGGHAYKLKADVLAGTPGLWTGTIVGYAGAGPPNDIWSVGNYAFVVGDAGYIYGMSNPVPGVTVLDAGVATPNDLLAVHALDKQFVVAVGNLNTIVRARDGHTFEAIAGPAAGVGDNLQAVWLINKNVWFIANDAGEFFYTLDGGENWTQIVDLPVTFTGIEDIAFSTPSVGYVGGTIGTAGVILRTYDGGNSWTAIPEGIGNLPDNDLIEAIAACKYDPNFVVGVGTDGTDGVFIVGEFSS